MSARTAQVDELLELAARGHDGAVQQLLSLYRTSLRQMVALRMDPRLRGRFDASDVVQETLLEASQKLPHYLRCRPVSFECWLRQIAGDHLVDLHRRHLLARMRSVLRETNGSFSDMGRGAVQSASAPWQNVVRHELRTGVQSALNQLSTQDRQILQFRHVHQYRIAEIAHRLQITEAATKSRLRRALERLHRILQSQE